MIIINCDILNFQERLNFRYIKFQTFSNKICNNFFQQKQVSSKDISLYQPGKIP